MILGTAQMWTAPQAESIVKAAIANETFYPRIRNDKGKRVRRNLPEILGHEQTENLDIEYLIGLADGYDRLPIAIRRHYGEKTWAFRRRKMRYWIGHNVQEQTTSGR